MAVTVRIPTQLRELSGGAAEVTTDGGTVADGARRASRPRTRASRERLFDESGELRRFVNVFVADEDIRFLDGVEHRRHRRPHRQHRPRRRRRLSREQRRSRGHRALWRRMSGGQAGIA